MNQVRRSNYGREYVDGNTVRKLNPDRDRDRRVYVDGKRVQENERQIRAREYAKIMNAPYVAFLAIVSAVCLIMCVCYLNIQSNIATLKGQISTVQSQNDALNYSINSYIDTDNIYKMATNKLGMKQATDDQISKYKLSDGGYTVQYGDIPNK